MLGRGAGCKLATSSLDAGYSYTLDLYGICTVFLTAVKRVIFEQLAELHLQMDHFTAVVQSLIHSNRAQD